MFWLLIEVVQLPVAVWRPQIVQKPVGPAALSALRALTLKPA